MGLNSLFAPDSQEVSLAALQIIAESIPSGVIVIEKAKGKIVFVNKRFSEITGFNPIGYSFREYALNMAKVRNLDSGPLLYEQLPIIQALDGIITRNCEISLHKADGLKLTVLVNTKPIVNGKQEIIGAIGVFEDVTERKKIEEALKASEARFRSLYDSNVEATLITSVDGATFFSANLAAQQLFGYSEEELKGLRRDEMVVNDERVQAGLAQRNKTGKFIGELSYKRKDGSTFEGEVYSSTFMDADGTLKASTIIKDITKRKKDEQELKRSEKAAIKYANKLKAVQEKLESKSAETEQYATKMESLAEERAGKLRESERLAAIGATAGMVGHDIRNPLQAISSDIYLLNDVLANLSDNRQKSELKESIDSITANVSYINKIVADLQDYARPLNPEYSVFDLPKLIKETLTTIIFPDNIKLSVDTEANRTIKSDLTYLRRSITNLVSNAIQAMPDGGNLEVKSFVQGDSVFVTVSDTGVGIPEHVRAKLFTPMMTTKSKGQGLGLAVVKRLIETLKGNISFESEEGKGTKFIIELPT